MNVRKIFLIGKLVLIVALLSLVVKTALIFQPTTELFTPASASGSDSIDTIDLTTAQEVPLWDYSTIVKQNIFAEAETPSAASLFPQVGANQMPPAEQELGLTLLGTVAASPPLARAIIREAKSNTPGLYRPGDVVAAARIESITKDTVVLRHHGQRKVLTLGTREAEHKSTKTQPATPQNTKTESQPADAGSSADATASPGVELAGLESILKKAVIRPYSVNGQMEGLRITALDKIPAAKDMGLRNGDIIRSVNGQHLTSKQKAYQVFKKARSGAGISIELLRGDEIKRLSFLLR